MVRKMTQEILQKFFEKLEGENKENNFKQTEIGLIPEDWEVVRLGEVSEIKQGKTPRREEYDDFQGFRIIKVKDFEDGEKVKIPAFGERSFTKVNLGERYQLKKGDSLILSASHSSEIVGQKIGYFDYDGDEKIFFVAELLRVRPDQTKIIPYFCFLILNLNATRNQIKEQVKGGHLYARDLKNILIPLPPLPEQRKIAGVLDKIQQAIELQDRIIEQAKNLKKSLMQKLFTEGLYGEEQKETEIGLIPKSRKVVRLGDIVTKTRQRDPKRMPYLKFKYVDVSSISNELYKIIEFREFLGKNAPSRARKEIKTGDIIFATVRPYLKRIAIVPQELDGELCSTAFCVLRCNMNFADHVFVFNYLLTDNFVERVSASQRGSSYPAVTDKDVLNQKIPLPPLSEQKQIAHILSVLDKKIEVEQKRKQVLKELFKTMLHKLMSGKIRLKEVEI